MFSAVTATDWSHSSSGLATLSQHFTGAKQHRRTAATLSLARANARLATAASTGTHRAQARCVFGLAAAPYLQCGLFFSFSPIGELIKTPRRRTRVNQDGLVEAMAAIILNDFFAERERRAALLDDLFAYDDDDYDYDNYDDFDNYDAYGYFHDYDDDDDDYEEPWWSHRGDRSL